MELNGAVAIVTGASRGVGAATAVGLAASGATVVCAARATEAAPLPIPGTIDDTVRAITAAGGTAIARPTNLAVDADVEAMVDDTITRFGRVDILVNNAAITFPGDIELPMKRFDLIFDVDLRAPVIATQRAVPGMIERGTGAIINVSSAAALNYYPGQMAYGMAKAALEHFTVSLAAQVAAHNISVNTFRIDVPVASEGSSPRCPISIIRTGSRPRSRPKASSGCCANRPTTPATTTGMARLRAEHEIMASRATRTHTQAAGMVTDSPIGR